MMKVWSPNKRWTFLFRGNVSTALSRIPQSQAFQVGGLATVRGTPEALMNNDSGYLVVAEARRLVWSGCESQSCCASVQPCDPVSTWRRDWKTYSKAEAFAFIDHGSVFDKDWTRGDFISSIGVGSTVQLGKYCALSGGYGQPIFTAWASDTYRSRLRHGNAFFSARVSF